MTCDDVMDAIYEAEGTEPAFHVLTRLRISLHLLHCSRCAGEMKKLKSARLLMRESFFPPGPGLEERIMRNVGWDDAPEELLGEYPAAAGFSFRSWVVTGLIVLVSLSTSVLGMDFVKVADKGGSAFLLPIGITIGAVVSAYGALFIGSHLKELSDRFNLR
jgi:hypothetical protein